MEISPDGEDYYDPADPPCVGLCYINKLKKLEEEKKANEGPREVPSPSTGLPRREKDKW